MLHLRVMKNSPSFKNRIATLMIVFSLVFAALPIIFGGNSAHAKAKSREGRKVSNTLLKKSHNLLDGPRVSVIVQLNGKMSPAFKALLSRYGIRIKSSTTSLNTFSADLPP